MKEVASILSAIKTKQPAPIYLLMGEEPYYIDLISNHIEKQVLSESEKAFNQTIVYGRDISIEDIVSSARQYPMMAERRVLLVKEAQDLSRSIEKLVSYAENPQPTTVLVLNYKYKKVDKHKKVYKAIAKTGVIYESKKLYENQVSGWISDVLKEKKYQIEPKASQMLVEFLGTDLRKINNELDKLMIVYPKNTVLLPEHIEENVGISKDFNNFELRKAVAEKNILKANKIIQYFSENPKNNPLVMTISLLHLFFTQLLVYHSLANKDKSTVAKTLRINPYFVSDYAVAAKKYPMRKTSQIIALLREADVKGKGVGAGSISSSDILKETLFKILH